MPTIAELRAATQPASIFERNSGEHWAGRLYIRRLSPYLTRALIPTAVTPNGVTWLMILAGVAAAAVLVLPGVLPAVAAVLLIQLQILLDCSDGELARWRGVKSVRGVYLDRIGHWLTEGALPIAIGIRAEEPILGLVAALMVLLIKGESALVAVARLESGLPPAADTQAVAAPRPTGLRRVRRAMGALPFYRAFVAMEATVLALAAAIVDAIAGDLIGSRVLIVALVAMTAITALGHLVAIITSDRLR
jgi:phosphatidylglycerophosphate synthase